jgi:hypothetical protein
MELTLTRENPDGSADFDLTLSPLEVQHIVNFGLVEILKRAIEEGKQYVPTSKAVSSEVSLGDTGSGEQDCVYGPCVKSGKSELRCICDQVTKVPY